MTRLHTVCAVLILLCCVFAARADGTKWALLVGVDDYKHISHLKYAVEDVKAVAQALVANAGFPKENVFVLTGDVKDEDDPNCPTHINVLKRLNRLANLIKPGDTFLFYFSGHGFQEENEQNFLATINTDPDSIETLEGSAVPLKTLREKLKRIAARQVIFIMDACRNAPEKDSKGDKDNLQTPGFAKSLVKVAQSANGGQSGTAVLFACSEGQRAWEWDEQKHGAFTYYLLAGLQGKAFGASGALTMSDLASYVQKGMEGWCAEHNRQQTPYLQTDGAAQIVLAQGKPSPSPLDGGKVVIHSLDAELEITSDPPGAQIYINGKPIPGMQTPATLSRALGIDMEQFTLQVGLRLNGYKDVLATVTLERGKRTPLAATLEKETDLLPDGGKFKHNPKDGAEMVYIPAGEFLMGYDDLSDNPRRKVTLPGYYIYETPVTVAQYKKFCHMTGHKMPQAPQFDPKWSKENHPIVNVTWNEAKSYCDWADVRLPTEQEWEKAARGTDGRKFPWGNQWDGRKCANSVGSQLGGTVAVGRYTDSPYGLSDMAGNIWQWCADDYDGTGHYPVLRGGGWGENRDIYFHCAYRYWLTPDDRYIANGFRCASSADSR